MDHLLTGLNKAQREAVTSSATVLQVLAPPGSGKTKTLTSRVAYLLSHQNYVPENVICCTFTIKAAREMRERLRGLVGGLENKLILGTFHSICRRYLVAYGHLIGIPKGFGIADSDDSLGIVKRLLKDKKYNIDPRAARNRISNRKARGQTIQDVIRNAKTQEAREFVDIFQAYEDALRTSNILDYDDLLLRCVELLQKHPECVSNVEALLIDEFQDTNNIQFELMKLLASAKQRITIVGDPDQSIYGFRCAEIENLQRMQHMFPETVVINLEENYRSSSAVLNLAQEVIEQDKQRPSKKLKSTHRYGTLPVLRRIPNPHEEASWIVAEIKRIVRTSGGLIGHSDIAILLRSAFLSLLVEKALANAAIPYKMVGGKRFFDRVEVRLLLDYLRTIAHPDNNSALLSIINTPARKVGETTVNDLLATAKKGKESLWSVIQKALKGEANTSKKLNSGAQSGLQELVSIINTGRNKLNTFEPIQAPGQLIELVVNKLNVQDYLRKCYKEDWEERWENVKELVLQAKDVTMQAMTDEERLPEIEGFAQAQIQGAQEVLSRFLANVALSTEVEAEEEENAKPRVTISTIHSAKGLEWPVVFVPAVYEGSIPHSRAEDTDEERRLLYVAMTRAKALLYMSFPIMQSRVESESILTQFLPTSINSKISETGPVMDNIVVKDIASILGRTMPTPEALAKSTTNLPTNESLFDDLWPADGAPRGPFTDIMTDHTGFGSGLSSAMNGRTYPFEQSREMATVSGFTSASTLPQAPEGPVEDIPKSKLRRVESNKGNIRSFFSRQTTTEEEKENVPLPVPRIVNPASSRHIPTLIKQYSAPTIPAEFMTHKLSTIGNSIHRSMKRPQPLQTLGSLSNKRQHACFSSSPVKEDFDEVTRVGSINADSASRASTLSSLANNVHKPYQSYQSGALNALTRPASLPRISSANTSRGRNLGVRRTMTSWNDRKNK